ncbi:S-adenosyl-L-methionine-dependent methyltransferase [Lipomyces kononenkoae]|uniref:S-adenosyl-L-methionine-dependent methyltransferase n=1 Tax=Lipomyces kononenkoae TaxID=34357 RepID=A0ACC3SZ93_LIPKO
MTSFSDNNYSSKDYSDFRPTYPSALFTTLIDYHKGPRNLAIDLGCGPGTATYPLSRYFAKVIGSDPSTVMIEQASKAAALKNQSNLQFVVSAAEDISSYIHSPGSVDLIFAAQSAHWFQHDKWFNECAMALRPGGTLAYCGYKDHCYVGSKLVNDMMLEFSYSDQYLGPYWEPGRQLLRNQLRDVIPPSNVFTNVQRIEYNAGESDPSGQLMAKTMTLDASESYVRTYSSFHNWRKDHPDEIARRDGGPGDIVDRLFDRVKNVTGWTERTILQVEWSSIIVLARRLL